MAIWCRAGSPHTRSEHVKYDHRRQKQTKCIQNYIGYWGREVALRQAPVTEKSVRVVHAYGRILCHVAAHLKFDTRCSFHSPPILFLLSCNEFQHELS